MIPTITYHLLVSKENPLFIESVTIPNAFRRVQYLKTIFPNLVIHRVIER